MEIRGREAETSSHLNRTPRWRLGPSTLTAAVGGQGVARGTEAGVGAHGVLARLRGAADVGRDGAFVHVRVAVGPRVARLAHTASHVVA